MIQDEIAKDFKIDSVPVIGIISKQEIIDYVKSKPLSLISNEKDYYRGE